MGIMALNWIMFLPALLLLFYPLENFLPSRSFCMRELAYVDFSQPSVRRRGPWTFPALWADGLRAFLGVWLLRGAWTIEHIGGWLHHVPMLTVISIIFLSIIVQMDVRHSRRERFLAPVTYIIGLWLALLPLPVALVAVAAGGVCMVAFRSLSAFFFFGSATVGVFGYLVLHAGSWVIVASAIGLVPYVVSMLGHRSLAMPVRVELMRERSRDVPTGKVLSMAGRDKIEV
jgi:hypothetical protein